MKVVTKALERYEGPQVTAIQFLTEQSVLTASSASSDSILDDMFETGGEWAGL